MKLAQEMKGCDSPNLKKCCRFIENVAPNIVILPGDKINFHFPDPLISKISAIGLTAIYAKSMSDLRITHMLLLGALHHSWV